jgi:DNA-binding FrmR family transcriptional regulator
MSHTIREKARLLARVRRVRGQVEALERALDAESGCGPVMHLIAGIRGSMTSLMADVMEDHVRAHFVDSDPGSSEPGAAEQLIEIVHAYLK